MSYFRSRYRRSSGFSPGSFRMKRVPFGGSFNLEYSVFFDDRLELFLAVPELVLPQVVLLNHLNSLNGAGIQAFTGEARQSFLDRLFVAWPDYRVKQFSQL